MNEAEELRALRDENQRLKKLVADLSLDKEMLKSLIAKNGYSSRVLGRSAQWGVRTPSI